MLKEERRSKLRAIHTQYKDYLSQLQAARIRRREEERRTIEKRAEKRRELQQQLLGSEIRSRFMDATMSTSAAAIERAEQRKTLEELNENTSSKSDPATLKRLLEKQQKVLQEMAAKKENEASLRREASERQRRLWESARRAVAGGMQKARPSQSDSDSEQPVRSLQAPGQSVQRRAAAAAHMPRKELRASVDARFDNSAAAAATTTAIVLERPRSRSVPARLVEEHTGSPKRVRNVRMASIVIAARPTATGRPPRPLPSLATAVPRPTISASIATSADFDTEPLDSSDDGSDAEDDVRPKTNKAYRRVPAPTDGQPSYLRPTRSTAANVTIPMDMMLWRRRHGLTEETKVFAIVGPYSDIRNALLARGWIENTDENTQLFDLKFSLTSRDIDRNALTKDQIINHFFKAAEITTKAGLARNIRELKWYDDIDVMSFFPRCFNLNIEDDLLDFIDDNRNTAAQLLLKRYCADLQLGTANTGTVCVPLLELAAEVCQRHASQLARDHDVDAQPKRAPTALQWKTILMCSVAASMRKPVPAAEEVVEAFSNALEAGGTAGIQSKAKRQKRLAVVKALLQQSAPSEALTQRINDVLALLQPSDPQYDLNGLRNIWIVKPAGKSRGRGICLFQDLDKITDHVAHNEGEWVAQKYIENPLIVMQRKFDIRLWVVVMDWNPLTIYLYKDCYLRFSCVPFSLDDIDNMYIHLCNNSIQKCSDEFDQSAIEGNMWTSKQYCDYLMQQHGSTALWDTQILPQIKRIVTWALQPAQEAIEHRKNSFELYGFDIMVDDKYRSHLIEVNSSPSLDKSTPVTAALVPAMCDDLIKLVVDRRADKGASIGQWEIVHRATSEVTRPIAAFGASFMCQGSGLGGSSGQLRASGRPTARLSKVNIG